MKTPRLQFGPRGTSRRGFSIVEAAFSVVIVGGLLIAAVNTVGASTSAQFFTADQGRGRLLAATLTAEILQQAYVDPGTSPVFGRETLESALSRVDFDDVDDYSGLLESPPVAKDGTALPGLSDWQLAVSVTLVAPNDFSLKSTTDQGFKRIIVTAAHSGKVVAELFAIKTGKPSADAVPIDPEPDLEPTGHQSMLQEN